jgi:hypothetical protein
MTRAQLSAQRNTKLAERLDDNAKLLAAVVYYLDRLSPGWNDAELILKHQKTLTANWQRHLKAARRVLGIHTHPPAMRLAKDYKNRLSIYASLDLFDFKTSREFRVLPADLTIDDAVRAFNQEHPQVLERTKAFLCRGYRPPRPPLPAFPDQPVPPDPTFPQYAPPKNTKPRDLLRKKLWEGGS